MLDKKKIIDTIAYELQIMGFGDANSFTQDYSKMNEVITNCKVFPWNQVADRLDMDRWRLYHWYFETFQRMILGAVSKEDQIIMKNLIKDAVQKNIQLTKQYQQYIKSQLKTDYHRSSFSIAFNNQKRQILKEMDKAPGQVRYQEIERFLETKQTQIREIRESRQTSMISEPQTPQILQTFKQFVPVIQNASKEKLFEFMNEPSTTTNDVLAGMNQKIQQYQTQLEDKKAISEKFGEVLENQQIEYLLSQLKKLEDDTKDLI
uniref:Uncharacterized protein n=1 Tax=Trepomonas sp. PC1 TaxID=1076344 RepID=A0A146KJU9_9EUKA|eukprot:JAP95539.1 hypothetical protein TPC1_11440 [Trepomonas sp. PC1]